MKTIFNDIGALFNLRLIRNETERTYTRKCLDARSRHLAQIFLLAGVIYNLAAFFLDGLFVSPHIREVLGVTHIAMAIVELLLFLVSVHYPRIDVRFSTPALQFCFLAICGASIYLTNDLNPVESAYLAYTMGSCVAFFTVTIPTYGWPSLALAAGTLAIPLWATSYQIHPDVWRVFQLECGAFGIIFFQYQTFSTIQRARHDAKELFKIAPAPIVRKSIQSDESLESLFHPKNRRCICLSSDWRNYQQMALEIPANTLKNRINRYYEYVQTFLEEDFPDGEYFTDWIADELFLVVYFEETDLVYQRRIVNQTIEFSCRLLNAKNEIFSDLPENLGVDVGLAVGEAMVGMMGPSGHQKATALGRLPGRSRRLQELGKLYRYNFGEQDRVIFGTDVMKAMLTTRPFRRAVIHQDLQLRDLTDEELYSLEPGNENGLEPASQKPYILYKPERRKTDNPADPKEATA